MIKFNSESREALKAGIDALANAVKVTLGPKGRNVIIDQNGTPHVTKDGVTVAKAVKLEDKFENLGAQLIKQAAEHTADEVGDATTTSTILAQYIINEGIKHIVAGANPMDLKRGIDKGVDYVVAKLKDLAREVDNSKIEQVATISANNDNTIGKLIAEAMAKVNNEGVITVEEAKGTDTYVDVVEGMQFDRGYISAYFISNTDKMLVELENPYILITNKKISTMKEMMGILEPVAQDGKSLLIIADDVDGEALSALVVNKLRGTLKIAAVKAPGFGDRRKDLLEDIAALTGATVVSTDKGMSLENADVKVLGSAARVTIGKENTTIVDGNGNKELINARIEQIRTRLTDTKDEIEKDNLTERLAKLAGGVAVMYVGAATEVEMKEKKDRVDDALAATRAAVEEGIVAGGGSTLLYLSNDLLELKGDNDDQTAGIRILYKALQEPIRQIANNAGQEGSVVLQNVKNYNDPEMGYNAKTGEYVNMYLAGIIDPTKASRVAQRRALYIEIYRAKASNCWNTL